MYLSFIDKNCYGNKYDASFNGVRLAIPEYNGKDFVVILNIY